MSETKPICVIYLDPNFTLGNSGKLTAPLELMAALNGNFGEPEDNKIKYNDYWNQYYWFVFYDYEIQTPRFEVFNVKDFTEIKYAELKKIIEDSLAKFKSKELK